MSSKGKSLTRLCSWTGVALLFTGCRAPTSSLPPDTILVNGKIVTMDSDDSIAEAVAIKNGRVVAIGSTESIESLAGDDTQKIDLAGRTATPGLIDSHNHFAVSAADALYSLDLAYPNVKTIADIVEKVREGAAGRGPGEWVTGGRWDEGKLKENRHIHAKDLDPVSPARPVWLTHTTSHYGVANTRALKLAGITKETPDPAGGLIDRYPDGTPTGILKDTAMSLIWPLVPEQTVEQLSTAIKRYLPELNKEGITASKTPKSASVFGRRTRGSWRKES